MWTPSRPARSGPSTSRPSRLWILAGLLGLAALLIVSQLLARQTAMESDGYHELRALGMTTRQIWAVGMARTALIGAVASSVGVALAMALSPVFPIGLAGIAEPHPGFSVDVITLAVTVGLSALILLVAAVWPNWRAAAESSWVVGRNERGAGRSRVVALARLRACRPPWWPVWASPWNGGMGGSPARSDPPSWPVSSASPR